MRRGRHGFRGSSLDWPRRYSLVGTERNASGAGTAAVVPAGVDIDLFRPQPVAQARAALGWPEDGRFILLPGARTNPTQGRCSLRCGRSRGCVTHVPKLTPISLEGFSREEVAHVMNAVDVTLMTSEFEGSPVSVKESLACMTPVVSVPVGGVPDMLAGLPGCAIAPRNPQSLAEAVLRAFESGGDPALRRRAEAVSREQVAGRIVAVYEHVLQAST